MHFPNQIKSINVTKYQKNEGDQTISGSLLTFFYVDEKKTNGVKI